MAEVLKYCSVEAGELNSFDTGLQYGLNKRLRNEYACNWSIKDFKGYHYDNCIHKQSA